MLCLCFWLRLFSAGRFVCITSIFLCENWRLPLPSHPYSLRPASVFHAPSSVFLSRSCCLCDFHTHTRTHLPFYSFRHAACFCITRQCHNAALCQLCSMKRSQALRQFTCRMTDSCIFSSSGACSDNWAEGYGWGWVGGFTAALQVKRSENWFSARA